MAVIRILRVLLVHAQSKWYTERTILLKDQKFCWIQIWK